MPTPPLFRVLICDDQELMRVGLRMVVDSQPDLTVIGEAADGVTAIEKAGFLVKDAPAAEMLVAIRGVLRGDAMVSPSLTRRLLDRFVTGTATSPPDSRLDVLTDRERAG